MCGDHLTVRNSCLCLDVGDGGKVVAQNHACTEKPRLEPRYMWDMVMASNPISLGALCSALPQLWRFLGFCCLLLKSRQEGPLTTILGALMITFSYSDHSNDSTGVSYVKLAVTFLLVSRRDARGSIVLRWLRWLRDLGETNRAPTVSPHCVWVLGKPSETTMRCITHYPTASSTVYMYSLCNHTFSYSHNPPTAGSHVPSQRV